MTSTRGRSQGPAEDEDHPVTMESPRAPRIGRHLRSSEAADVGATPSRTFDATGRPRRRRPDRMLGEQHSQRLGCGNNAAPLKIRSFPEPGTPSCGRFRRFEAPLIQHATVARRIGGTTASRSASGQFLHGGIENGTNPIPLGKAGRTNGVGHGGKVGFADPTASLRTACSAAAIRTLE